MCNLGQRHLRESTQLVIGGGFKDEERCVAITRDSCVDVEDLKSNQEEADTRMLLHAKYAAGQCQEAKIVIQSPDTDVLVLSAAHFEDIASKELWFRTGVKDRLRFVPVHDVCQNLSNRVLKALPAFHALTGCDTTSALSGIGKKKPWNVFIRSAAHQESLTILGQQPEVDEETAKKCEAFICDLYPSYKKSPKTADELGYIIFCQKKPNSEALPPTSDSLRQHINRANYQTHIWRKSLDALLELHLPKDAGGKKKMMSWRQSWCPRTRHLPAYRTLRRVPARRKSAAATVLVQMSVSHVQKLAPVWRRTRVRTHMEWNGSWRTMIPMTRSEHVQKVYSCSLFSFGTGCRCTIWSVAL